MGSLFPFRDDSKKSYNARREAVKIAGCKTVVGTETSCIYDVQAPFLPGGLKGAVPPSVKSAGPALPVRGSERPENVPVAHF
jgi:hypothetical protein